MELWRRTALFAFALLLAVSWIALDSLSLTPVEEQVVEVPNYCGLVAVELTPLSWLEIETEYRYDSSLPAGTVLSQMPEGGSLCKLSERHPVCEMTLVVSLGVESPILPELVGEDARVATAALRELGFSVHIQEVHAARPAGEVLSLSPSPGSALPRGSVVTLTVSIGEQIGMVTVPNLKGLSRAEALMQLWRTGLSVGEVVEEASTAPPGTIIRQSHPAGCRVSAGTPVTLYASAEEPS